MNLRLIALLVAALFWAGSLIGAFWLGGVQQRKDFAEKELAYQKALVEASLKQQEVAVRVEEKLVSVIQEVERQVPVLKEVIRDNPTSCPAGDDPFVDSLRIAVDQANARLRAANSRD